MTTQHVERPVDSTTVLRERILLLMFRLRVSQAMIGKVIGVTQTTVGKKLRGEVPLTVAELFAIASYLQVPVAELVDETPDPVTSVTRPGADSVRHQGLEPRTRWLRARRAWELVA